MTSTPITSVSGSQSGSRPLISLPGWICIIVLAALFMAFHFVILRRTYMFATTDADWSHALAIPLISLFYIYQKRDELMQIQPRLCFWGLPIVFAGLFAYAFGILPVRNDMFQGYAMILSLFGLVLLLLGPRMMRILWFPILFLALGIKISDRIWTEIAFHLQQIAAVGATFVLKVLAELPGRLHTVDFHGSTIELGFWTASGGYATEPLNVAEACAGLRMLMAFLALGAAVAFLWNRTWWQKIIMIAMAPVIAIGVNILRVAVLGMLYPYNPEFAQGGFHQMIGMFMLIPALGLFVLLGWVLDKMVIQEPGSSRKKAAEQTGSGSQAAQREPASGPPAYGKLGVLLGWGAAMAALFWVSYMLLLAGLEPELLPVNLPAAALIAGVLVSGLLFLGAMVVLPRWVGRRLVEPAQARLGVVALMGGVLAVSIVGQNGATAATGAVLFKEPVPLRWELDYMPVQVGSWNMIYEAPPLSREMEEELGTDEYVIRIYEDQQWDQDEPGGRVQVHMTYYTGTVDTVPHVPERCFVGAGMIYEGSSTDRLNITSPHFEPDPETGGYQHPAELEPTVRIPSRQITTTHFTFSDRNERDRREHVHYFFVSNGRFIATPDGVRLHGFNPLDRHSYYAKVEIRVLEVADEDKARERAQAFLSRMLPEIMAMLPDWHAVEQGDWPPQQEDVG